MEDTLTPATVNTTRLTPSTAFMTRSTSTMRPRSLGERERGLFYLNAAHLPYRAAVVFLRLEVRVAVERVDDEERTLVAHGHVFAVALQGEQHAELADVFHRDLGAVVVEPDRDDAFAAGADRIHQLGERYALELDRLLVPGGVGRERRDAKRFEHLAVELRGRILVRLADLAADGQDRLVGGLAQRSGAGQARRREHEHAEQQRGHGAGH